MARIKRAVNALKKRRKVMKLAKGYWGPSPSSTAPRPSRSPVPCATPILAASCVSVISAVCGSPVSTLLPVSTA